jgi:hypothetical protein
VPLVESWMAAHPHLTDWVLTAPAFDVLPAAANLLCHALHGLLGERLPPHVRATVIDIRQAKVDPAVADARELGRANLYSQLGWEERRESRVYWNSLMVEHAGFAGRPVIFVNDINVTGAQREGMERYFARVGAASVTWVYVIDVDEAVGRREPQLEHAINNARPFSVDELGEVLSSARVRFTSKCIARIFDYETPEMERLLSLLGADRRAEILRLAVAEGRYDGPGFEEKLELLRSLGGPGARRLP